MSDRSDELVVTWTRSYQPDRRIVFEPTDDGDYTRVEKVRQNATDAWDEVGYERVDAVSVEGKADV